MMGTFKQIRLVAAVALLVSICHSASAAYDIGIGIADCTGPAAEVNFMGYAQLAQKGTGLHLRQFARAFIVGDGSNRFVFVSVDTGMIGYGMREAVIENLSAKYGNTYTIQNVIISGTHTHGTPGGFMQHFMFDITVLGHVRQTFDGLVEGITTAIENAHANIIPGRIFINHGTVLNSNINRSPASYLRNPESERAQYDYNVDKDMYQLKFTSSATNTVIGLINWFPIHPVSMNNTNLLITSDNVGYAAILMEKALNNGALPGKGSVVTAFASANLGDVSPNTEGPRCIDTGLPCDEVTSTCNGQSMYCIAFGPGENMYESTKIIAQNLYTKAQELMVSTSSRELTGAVRAIHQFVDMPTQSAIYQLGDGTTMTGTGCKAAMGYSFAAGTTDGPGEFDFTQGTSGEGNTFWNLVRNLLATPSAADIACQAPKPILLATGQMTKPYEWQPRIVSTQLAMIGDVAIAAVPGEFTTMAGRRLKNAIKNTMIAQGLPNAEVILAGLSNHYTDYVTTYEEYQLQRYEGASTVYGPHTHGIYLSQYQRLATALIMGVSLDAGPTPPTFDQDNLISLVGSVILDTPDLDNDFGYCSEQPPATATRGQTVTVKFVSGHPRNNLMHGESFLTVERQNGNNWDVVATDAVWETRFTWTRTYLATSEVTIEWDIPSDAQTGTYRIQHFGYAKSLFANPHAYSGTTNTFTVA